MAILGAVILALFPLAGAGPAGKPTPTRTPPPPPSVKLTTAQKTQAQKTLTSEAGKKQSLRDKQKTPPTGPARFQAHRCAVLYDESVSGRQREADGPFRVSCTDWVYRSTRELSIKDGDRPCTARDYGPSFAGCTTWVDGWDGKRGKWVELWRKAAP